MGEFPKFDGKLFDYAFAACQNVFVDTRLDSNPGSYYPQPSQAELAVVFRKTDCVFIRVIVRIF